MRRYHVLRCHLLCELPLLLLLQLLLRERERGGINFVADLLEVHLHLQQDALWKCPAPCVVELRQVHLRPRIGEDENPRVRLVGARRGVALTGTTGHRGSSCQFPTFDC